MAGQGAGGKGDLQVVAAGDGVHVQHLPAKYKPLTSLDSMVWGSTSLTLTPPLVMMASSTGRRALGRQGQALNGQGQGLLLPVVELVAGGLLRHARLQGQDGRKRLGLQAMEQALQLFPGSLGDVPVQARQQLLLGEAGL